MSQAIEIKYLGPTDHQGARLKATAGAGSITVGRDYGIDADTQARILAREYIQKHWPHSVLHGFGTLPSGNYCAVIVPRGLSSLYTEDTPPLKPALAVTIVKELEGLLPKVTLPKPKYISKELTGDALQDYIDRRFNGEGSK